MLSSKTILVIVWAVNAVVSLLYAIFSGTVFHKLEWARNVLEENDSDVAGKIRLSLMGVLATIVMSIMFSVLYNTYTLLLILGRWLTAKMMRGFGHGVVVTSSLFMAGFMLEGGLVLHSNRYLVKDLYNLSDKDHNLYMLAIAFAYILCATHLAMLALLIFCRSAFIPSEPGAGQLIDATHQSSAPIA